MHIQTIEVINFKNIREFRADLTKGIYLVTGENDIGKSHLIQAIVTMLTGSRTENNLTTGEKNGQIKMLVDAGDAKWEVALKFSESNPRGTLTIGKEGDPFTSSQLTALQQIFNYTDFDAGEFIRWGTTSEGRKKQIEAVRRLMPKEVVEQIDALDQQINQAYESRTIHNREVKRLEGVLQTMAVTPEMTKSYTKKMDPAAIAKKIQSYNENEANAKNAKATGQGAKEAIESQRAAIERKREMIAKLNEEIAEEEKRIEHNEKVRAEAKTKYETAQAAMAKIDIASLQGQLKTANTHNELCDKVDRYQVTKREYDKAIDNSTECDRTVKESREKRELLIKEKGTLPVPGLTFGEDGLILNGIPFLPGEVSSSQEMEVAARLIIASNPKTKVFKMMHGESMGTAKFEALAKFAKENGYQGFIEVVKPGQNEMIVTEYQES